MSNIYEQISNENKKRYGYDVSQYGKILLADLYSDKTHFIFELLQNAEDACKREYEHNNKKKKFFAQFELYPNKLVFTHNGVKFSNEDIHDICLIGRSHKVNKIGKFGIGFKSVYAFTDNPKIYSCNKSFEILDYVHPREINELKEKIDFTKIIIEFNKKEVDEQTAYEEINHKLSNFDIQNIIFLKHLNVVKWKIFDKSNSMIDEGKYLKKRVQNNYQQMNLLCLKDICNSETAKEHYWLLMNNGKGGNNYLELAFKFDYENKTVLPVENAKLSVFFLLELETHLKFLINGWFEPIPNRENIKRNKWNIKLIQKAAEFLANSLEIFRRNGFLDLNLYNVLPIEFTKKSHYGKEIEINYDRFNIFFRAIEEKLLKDRLLLCSDGKFHISEEILIARNKELVELLQPKKCEYIFGKKYWIAPDVSENSRTTRNIFYYFRDILGIPVIRPEDFAKNITKEFLKEQSDNWMKKFYLYLKKFIGRELLDKFLEKPIFRLVDNNHITLNRNEPNIYLPVQDYHSLKGDFNFIKPSLATNEELIEFFVELNIKKSGNEDIEFKIFETIIESNEEKKLNWEEHISNIRDIKEVYENFNEKYRKKVLKKLKETKFFFSVNANLEDKNLDYESQQIYYPFEDIYNFFEGNENIRILDKKYVKEIEIFNFIKRIGFKNLPQIGLSRLKNNFIEGVKKTILAIVKYLPFADRRGLHIKGLDGFDPNFEIEGLEYAIDNINYKKSKIIWSLAKDFIFGIYGKIEKATRKDYSNSEQYEKFSKMGNMMVENKWLPNKQGEFFYPKELSLSDLPDDFETESANSMKLAKVLLMKESELGNSLKKLEEDAPGITKIFNIFKCSSDKQKASYIKILEQQKNKNDNEKEMKDILSSRKPKNKVRVRDKTKGRVRTSSSIKRKKKSRRVRTSQKDSKELAKISLFVEYFDKNHDTARCQLCHKPLSECSFKTKEGKYYHGTEQIVNSDKLNSETEYPYLFLCPYCAAKYHYARTSKLLDNEDIINQILQLEIENEYYIKIDLLQNNDSEKIYFSPKHLIGLQEIFKSSNI